MSTITASDVNKLRKQTGAGMMDCKKALISASGNFDEAIDILRKQGQKVASKRADRDAAEGVVIAGVNNTRGIIISLNCETDFVAKNNDFILLAQSILEAALKSNITSNEELRSIDLEPELTIDEKILEQTGVIGEKLDVSIEIIQSEKVSFYIHPGNRLATIIGFENLNNLQVGKDIAMQVAAMNPIAIDRDSVSEEIINRELSIGKEQAREEGKPEAMLEKIALGRLNKFFKENTLLDQIFIKDNKISVRQYLSESDKDATITMFKRVALSN
ncbi:MAG: translation elongation factor Ts [Bacteroidota bacterium]|nr:translation elongation factor Ts [Bacteroidota bacterium]